MSGAATKLTLKISDTHVKSVISMSVWFAQNSLVQLSIWAHILCESEADSLLELSSHHFLFMCRVNEETDRFIVSLSKSDIIIGELVDIAERLNSVQETVLQLHR